MKKFWDEHRDDIAMGWWMLLALVGIGIYIMSDKPRWVSGVVLLALGINGASAKLHEVQRRIDRIERNLLIDIAVDLARLQEQQQERQ